MKDSQVKLPYKEPPYFQMFRETCAMLEKLPDTAFVPVLRAGFAYFLHGEIITVSDPILQAILESFQMTIQRSIDAYNQNRINGSIGGKKAHENHLPPLTPLEDAIPTEQNRTEQNISKQTNSNIPSSVGEVWDYARKLNSENKYSMTEEDCKAFLDHHSARGWILSNGKPVKDWHSAFRTWARNSQKFGHAPEPDCRIKDNSTAALVDQLGFDPWKDDVE